VPLVTRVPTATPRRPALPTPTVAPPAAGEPLTVLLLGTDGRPGQTAPPYTDAILVVRLDPVSGRAALLSLPRDLWVDIPGHGSQRLNQAYALGEQVAPGQGPALAKATVAALLDIPVDAYVVVDFDGFVALVDAIGGITLDVERDLYDSQYPTMDYGYHEMYFAKGRTHMDGMTALVYSRIRHSDSDFQRIERQHDVLAAIAHRLAERGLLRNLAQADAMTAALRPHLQSDIPPQRMLGLLWALRDLDPASVPQLSVSPTMVRLGVGRDLYAQVPNLASLRALGAQLMHE
jgi:polyisoprenyl-teichoic acid--peptidoglycan teichoic acid transferase